MITNYKLFGYLSTFEFGYIFCELKYTYFLKPLYRYFYWVNNMIWFMISKGHSTQKKIVCRKVSLNMQHKLGNFVGNLGLAI